jgi:hypothetical protein
MLATAAPKKEPPSPRHQVHTDFIPTFDLGGSTDFLKLTANK